MNAVEIRPCAADDVEALAAVVNAAYRQEGGWTTEAGIVAGERASAGELARSLEDGAEILTAWTHGRLAGCVRLEPDGEDAVLIGLLAVRPDLQAAGVGRALLEAAETRAAQAEKRIARMTVISIRDDILAWYVRRGYRPTGDRKPFPYEVLPAGVPQRQGLEFLVLEKAIG